MRTIVLAAAFALAPVGAWGQAKEEIFETKQRASLESDIRNGRSRKEICIQAKGAAGASYETSFKEWAYSIANQYCDGSDTGGEAGPTASDAKPKAATPTPEQPQFVNGVMVPLCSHGMPCLGQLRRAMGIWE
jgi:hypothetical protein